jgi:hypothetical protein
MGTMSTHTIKEGSHYDNKPFSRLPWISFNPSCKYSVRFADNCRYVFPAYNQGDVNKLLGLNFGYRGVHYNSARFGWRWSETDQCIELLAYIYRKGERNWDAQKLFPVLEQVKLNDVIELEIISTKDSYIFNTQKSGEAKKTTVYPHEPQLQWFGLTDSLFFGGIMPAPHEIDVEITRI